jgi:predicted methyltransferase
MNATRLFTAILLTAGIAACGRQEPAAPLAETPAAGTQPAAASGTDSLQSLLTKPGRFASDAAEDAWRRSPEVLAFLQLQPGMHVLDYLAGGGYYSELLSGVVGPDGRVYAYNNPEYAKYSGDVPAKRYADQRLSNVTQLDGAPEALTLDPASLDAVLFVQSYHDLYWRPKDGSWTPTDPAQSLARVVAALKPGAVAVVIDHAAVAGGDPAATVDALHRIDPAVVKRDFEAAGLVFDAESPLFQNPADDHTKAVFDESIRHKTDQFMYRFRKPS